MRRLTLDEVEDIGTVAIRRVIGDTFADAEFRVDIDLDGKPAYSIRLQFSTAEAWRNASVRISEITGALMECLALRDDDSFPFVWLPSDGSWTFGRDAAAE